MNHADQKAAVVRLADSLDAQASAFMRMTEAVEGLTGALCEQIAEVADRLDRIERHLGIPYSPEDDDG